MFRITYFIKLHHRDCDGLAVVLNEAYMNYKLSQWTLAHAGDKGQLIYSVEWTAIAGVVSAHGSLELDVTLAADMLERCIKDMLGTWF